MTGTGAAVAVFPAALAVAMLRSFWDPFTAGTLPGSGGASFLENSWL